MDQLRSEIEVLRGFVPFDDIDGIVSFAPACHLYGWLFTVLIPNTVGVPVRYETPGPDATFAHAGKARSMLAMIPSAWSALRREVDLGLEMPPTFAVHSTAVFPAAARDLIGRSGIDLRAVELFGSTETGLVAHRFSTPAGDGHWQLAADVEFAEMAQDGSEEQLRVRSPRLASLDESPPPSCWTMDDWVEVSGDRSFIFGGRRSRSVNVNGRRVDLDGIEEILRAAVPCLDLACVAVMDPTRGEHFELRIVPLPAGGPSPLELRQAVRSLLPPPRPGRIRLVTVIDRSATGKLRRLQPAPPPDA